MSASHQSPGTPSVALMHEIDRLIGERRPDAAVRAAIQAVETGTLTIPEVHVLVLAPLMALTGARWQAGDEEVWEEHYTTAIVRTIVENMHPLVTARSADATPVDRTVVLACPEEEYHDLGLRMLADRFALAGYLTHFLGAALPLEQLIAAVRELGADTVVLSASTHFHRVQLREYVDSLHDELPDVRLWVGGPAFARGHSGWSDDEVPDIAAVLDDLRAVE